MRKMIKAWREKAVRVSFLAALLFFMNPMTVYATGGGIGGSKLATGKQQLIQESTTYLKVIAPIVAGLFIIYFCIRRSAADEMDQKKWNNRIAVAVVSCVGAVLGSATLNVIIGYYQ